MAAGDTGAGVPSKLGKAGDTSFSAPRSPGTPAVIRSSFTDLPQPRPEPRGDALAPAKTAESRYATYFHVHLVSDSTGETLNAMARAVCARFTDVLPIEHIYALVRSSRQLERALEEIAGAPGVVMHTIIDPALRTALEEGCRRLEMPCIAALDPVVSAMSRYLGARISTRVGAQHALDNDYFDRMEALNYAIAHDDGNGGQDLNLADVILVGVSRTSKTPTSIYLAHRGIRAANVPLVPGSDAEPQLVALGRKGKLIVGLTASPDRLIQIRRNRLLSLREDRESAYVDVDAVREEIVRARRMFERHGWPIIDVSRRSVEETAASIINLLSGGRGKVEVIG
jgi:regulator of PEP synthase PpsR (kinase-PPPase family)